MGVRYGIKELALKHLNGLILYTKQEGRRHKRTRLFADLCGIRRVSLANPTPTLTLAHTPPYYSCRRARETGQRLTPGTAASFSTSSRSASPSLRARRWCQPPSTPRARKSTDRLAMRSTTLICVASPT